MAVNIHAASLLLLALSSPALAQLEEPRDIRVEHRYDSGWVSNETDSPEVVISFPVHIQTARSLRLYFEDVQLAPGSTLRITALRDDAIQFMNAEHVAQWQNSSCYFNGNAVQVEVIAHPGTGPNRVVLDSVDLALAQNEYETICGGDDRQPSNDPRVSRLLPVGCTSWLIEDCGKCYLTAGHCVGFINAVEYNVPFSNSNGSWNHPGPEDQYPVDSSSIQSTNGGVGNDFAYFGTFPNSNTGLTAYEAQGSAFELVPAPSTTSGNTIRITGHGTDSSPNSTFNQVQQTHVGPLIGVGTNSLQYQTDTTGGNSGSPVIWEQTDQAIGIHTHGGCGGSGGNNGTTFTQAGLQNFLNNPLGVCLLGSAGGPFEDLGNGKSGTFFAAPDLTACGSLTANSSLTLTLSVPFNMSGLVATRFIGFTELNAPFKGGTLVPSPTLVLTGLPIANEMPPSSTLVLDVVWPAGVPSGAEVVVQDWVNVPFFLGDELIASNGLKLTSP